MNSNNYHFVTSWRFKEIIDEDSSLKYGVNQNSNPNSFFTSGWTSTSFLQFCNRSNCNSDFFHFVGLAKLLILNMTTY